MRRQIEPPQHRAHPPRYPMRWYAYQKPRPDSEACFLLLYWSEEEFGPFIAADRGRPARTRARAQIAECGWRTPARNCIATVECTRDKSDSPDDCENGRAGALPGQFVRRPPYVRKTHLTRMLDHTTWALSSMSPAQHAGGHAINSSYRAECSAHRRPRESAASWPLLGRPETAPKKPGQVPESRAMRLKRS